jgi:acyl-CoA synthetase (AMP-forming)/AMP-acid ligase II
MSMPNRNLGCCFDMREPDKVAISDIGDWDRPIEFTYRQFDAECDAFARGLVKRGCERGDRIGILSLNRWEYLAAFFGAMRAGMVTVPISIKLPRDTIDYIIRDAGLKAILHDRDRESLAASCPTRISFDDQAGYQALRDPGPFTPVMVQGHELGMMLYTSGSTGRPKGVLLSHESQYFAMDNMAKFFGEGRHHRYVVAAPMFHMNATYSVKAALMGGASLVLMPQFNAQLYARAIARFKVTWLTSVPTMLALVLRETELLKSLDFSSVERVTMGSAPLTQALIDKVQAQFPKAILNNSYGTTEAGPVPFGPHPQGKKRPTLSVGYPAPGVQCELREGPSPDEGVLCMKSKMAMDGYNNLPEKTREAVRDGWYRSGDIMRRDADGFFYFLGRADDMFVCGGENIWPGEVEKMLERLDGVHQAFVVPVPDEIKGQLPFAFIVRKPGAALDEAQVKEFALANGPAYAHPRWVEFVPELTLAATNKIDRRGLTERALQVVAKRPRAQR